ANDYALDLRKASYRVSKISRKEQKRRAPPPYTTSKLQQDGSTRLGLPPKRTMSIAQGLYEGVELGRGGGAETVGLITALTADSARLWGARVAACREFVEKIYGARALPPEPNFFKSNKQNVQDAHEAIRPTRMDLPPDSIRKALKEDQYKLYKL